MDPSKSQYSSSQQWSAQQHRSSSGNYVTSSSSTYDPAAQRYNTGDPNANYAPNYYMANNDPYLPVGTSSSTVNPHHHRYSHSVATTPHAPSQTHHQHYPSHSHTPHSPDHSHSPASPSTHVHGHSHNHSVSHPYEQPYMQSYSAQGRARSHSHSQMSSYESPSVAPYPPQVPLPPSTSMTQYTASPSRPFACDLCSLSFNRQHDLKRHRETHTGEKPYLCNGGCGKTFTRKDALKRHQLVKGCGKVDETWS